MSFGVNLNCQINDVEFDMGIYFETSYTCEVTSLDNSDNNIVINGHNGVNQLNKNDTDVKAIYFHDTNTKYIRENLGYLFNLTFFIMYNTQLIEIKAKDFNGMDNLNTLSLFNNKLSSVPSNAFNKLTKLKLISLRNNQIEALPIGLFLNNINLETIYLHDNKLKFLGPN